MLIGVIKFPAYCFVPNPIAADWRAEETGAGGEGAVHRVVGGEPRHDQARARRAPHHRGADGVVALVSGHRARDCAALQVSSGHRLHCTLAMLIVLHDYDYRVNLTNRVHILCYVDARELGIGIVPYSPIGKGFFGGRGVTEQVSAESNLVFTLAYGSVLLY